MSIIRKISVVRMCYWFFRKKINRYRFSNFRILTFAKGSFIKSQDILDEHLRSLGIRNITNFTDKQLPSEFKNEFDYLLKNQRGYGYCIWKPFLIAHELKKLKRNEVLIYIDSTDVVYNKFFHFVRKKMKYADYIFFNRGFKQAEYTKRDTFVRMDCDLNTFHNHVQLEAGLIVLKNTRFCRELVDQWFDYCKDEYILTEHPNISGNPNLEGFISHRYDQSVLTNLIAKNRIDSYNLSREYVHYNFNQPDDY